MGFRTVLMLSNDYAQDWQNDPELGKKIARAMNYAHGGEPRDADIGNYGRVIECVHADAQSLLVLSEYRSCQPLAMTHWQQAEAPDAVAIKLLQHAADKLGFRLVAKAQRSPAKGTNSSAPTAAPSGRRSRGQRTAGLLENKDG